MREAVRRYVSRLRCRCVVFFRFLSLFGLSKWWSTNISRKDTPLSLITFHFNNSITKNAARINNQSKPVQVSYSKNLMLSNSRHPPSIRYQREKYPFSKKKPSAAHLSIWQIHQVSPDFVHPAQLREEGNGVVQVDEQWSRSHLRDGLSQVKKFGHLRHPPVHVLVDQLQPLLLEVPQNPALVGPPLADQAQLSHSHQVLPPQLPDRLQVAPPPVLAGLLSAAWARPCRQRRGPPVGERASWLEGRPSFRVKTLIFRRLHACKHTRNRLKLLK